MSKSKGQLYRVLRTTYCTIADIAGLYESNQEFLEPTGDFVSN
jgi:hypothetical protein